MKHFINIKNIALFAVIAVLTVMTMTGCTTFDNFRKAFIDKSDDSKTTVQIGVFEPMSGSDSEDAEAELKGIELAHEIYPSMGGRVVELTYSDNSSDIYAAETAIKNLVASEPAVILGSYGSVYSLTAGDTVYDAKIPAIAVSNSNPLVTRNNPYYFRVCYVDSNQGDILARYILESRGEKTAGVMIPEDDDAAVAMATAFTDRIKTETGNEDAITVYETYKAGDEDFSEQLDEISSSGVKCVLLAGDMTDSVNIMKQAEKMGLGTLFLGDSDWSTDEFTETAGKDFSGSNAAFINFFTSEETSTKESETFLNAYHDKYGQNSEPDNNTALGFDAYMVAIKAIDKVEGEVTGEKVKKVLSGQTSFEGATGEIKFNNMGDPIKTAYISMRDNGTLTTIYTVEPQL